MVFETLPRLVSQNVATTSTKKKHINETNCPNLLSTSEVIQQTLLCYIIKVSLRRL